MSNEFGREPVQIVEIDQDFCENTYGAAPCTASIGVTGTRKCFNTFSTCQDKDNFLREFLTLRFCSKQVDIPKDWRAIPSIQRISTTPTVLNIGGRSKRSGPLGERSSATIILQDHPDADIFTDPYLGDRSYNALDRGTFWSKWLARNKYFKNRPLRIREGYLGQSIDDMQVKHYVIDTINGPDSNGRVTIKALDVLRLADDDRAQAPAQSRGILAAAINDDDMAFSVSGADISEYPSSGTVRINDEVITYSAVVFNGGTENLDFTVSARATDGTEASDHDQDDTVQLCLRYTNQDVWLVIQDLLENYAGVPSEFIPIDDWIAEGELWLENFEVSTLITEPTGVVTLLGELCEQCLVYIWWDEREQKVNLRAIRAPTSTPVRLNDTAHILQGSFSTKIEPEEFYTQIWFYYLPRDYTEIRDDKDFRRATIRVNPDAESENQHGETRIKKIFSRWLTSEPPVTVLLTRLGDQLVDPPRYTKFRLDAKDRDIWTGSIVDIDAREFIDDTGLRDPKRHIIISAHEVMSGHTIEYEALLYDFITGNGAFWMNESAPDYGDATDSEKENGAWWADEYGMIDGNDGYVWQ